MLSGLNTNLGLLDTGKIWGYIVLICTIAFFGKFSGCFVTAKAFGFTWRESGAIGSLMSCKGLVELIVLNVGRQAGILNSQLFSMFVVHAIVLTFMTTPLTLLWYPLHVRTKASDENAVEDASAGPSGDSSLFEYVTKTNFAVILNRVEHLPALMTLTQLLRRPMHDSSMEVTRLPSNIDEKVSQQSVDAPSSLPYDTKGKLVKPKLASLSALRLVELTERTSAVLKSQEASAEYLARADPLLTVFRTFGRLHNAIVHSALAVISIDEFAGRVSTFARERGAQMVVVPWAMGGVTSAEEVAPSHTHMNNPFDSFFTRNSSDKQLTTPTHSTPSVVYSSFARRVFAEAPADVALFVDRSGAENADIDISDTPSGGFHIFLPFFGGPDDRLALEFTVQLCANRNVTATVLRVQKSEGHERNSFSSIDAEKRAALANFTLSVSNYAGLS